MVEGITRESPTSGGEVRHDQGTGRRAKLDASVRTTRNPDPLRQGRLNLDTIDCPDGRLSGPFSRRFCSARHRRAEQSSAANWEAPPAREEEYTTVNGACAFFGAVCPPDADRLASVGPALPKADKVGSPVIRLTKTRAGHGRP